MLTRTLAAGRADPVTGLPDRAELERRIAVAAGSGQQVLLVLDVEVSAGVGTGFGRHAADDVLRRLARRVRAARPAADAVARIGEHRFAVLRGEASGPPPEQVARRLIAVVEEPVLNGRVPVSIGCAIGIATSGPGLPTGTDLLTAAEQAAGAARRAGRGGCVTFDQALRAHAVSQSTLEHGLREAVRFGWIDAGYAPVRSLGADPGEDRVELAIARPRWTLGDGTDVPAARFLPLADELGIGPELGRQALRTALDALAAWRAADCSLRLAVEVGPALLEDPDLAHDLGTLLAERDLPAGCLTVRLGAARLRESDACLSTLGMLRSLGAGVELAEFGRRGTSLTGLRALPLTGVEMDAALAAELTTDRRPPPGSWPGEGGGRTDAVPQAVLAMCRGLRLAGTVAGVADATQLEAARLLGADAVTGPLVGDPVPAAAVPGLSRAFLAEPLTVVRWDA